MEEITLRSLAAGIVFPVIATTQGICTLAAESKPSAPSPRLSQRAKDYLDLVEKSETSKNHYETIAILELNDDDFRAVVPELIVMLRNRNRLRPPRTWGGSRPDRVCDRALVALDFAADKSLAHLSKSGRFSESELDVEAEQIIADVSKWWEANRDKTQEDRIKERLARCPKRPGGGWDLDNFTIHALASGCHKDSAEILLQTLESDAGRFERERPWSPSMSAMLVESLGKLGDKKVVPRLIAVAKKTNKPQNDEYGSLPEALVTTLNVLTGLKLDPIEKKSRGWVTRGGMTGARDVEIFDYTIKPEAFDAWLKAAAEQTRKS